MCDEAVDIQIEVEAPIELLLSESNPCAVNYVLAGPRGEKGEKGDLGGNNYWEEAKW